MRARLLLLLLAASACQCDDASLALGHDAGLSPPPRSQPRDAGAPDSGRVSVTELCEAIIDTYCLARAPCGCSRDEAACQREGHDWCDRERQNLELRGADTSGFVVNGARVAERVNESETPKSAIY